MTEKRLPQPGSLSTLMLPPIMSTRLLTMGRPRPVPYTPLMVVLAWRSKGSKMWGRKALEMPMPSSATVKR